MMSILVTGASGFVGRVTCKALAERGFSPRAVIRDSSDPHIVGTHETVTVNEIGPSTDWGSALHSVDTIIHLAARVHVMNDTDVDSMAKFRKVNLEGTENLATQAASSGVRRFVYVSSIKVNGEKTSERAFSELDHPNPKNPYGRSKWEAELALHRIAIQTGMEVVILRPPLVYGPDVKGNFRTMLKVLCRGVPLPLGAVKNDRSLVYVENLADALVLCATHPAAGGETYLISDGEDISTSELLRNLCELLDVPMRLLPVPTSVLRIGGAILGKSGALERLLGSLIVDSSKIQRELGWAPPITLIEGLRRTAEWFKQDHV